MQLVLVSLHPYRIYNVHLYRWCFLVHSYTGFNTLTCASDASLITPLISRLCMVYHAYLCRWCWLAYTSYISSVHGLQPLKKQNTPDTDHILTFSPLIHTLSHILQSSKLKCPHCDKAIGKTNMPRHLREIHDETLARVTCKFCDMTFKWQQDHMRHIYRCHYETDDFPTHTPSARVNY